MLPGIKQAIFPRRYVQGPGALKYAGKLVSIFSKKPLVMGGERALAAVEKHGLFKSFEAAGIKYVKEKFGVPPWGPESCDEEIDRLVKIGRENNVDGVVAVGGGKAIDTGKAVADKLGTEVIIIPTIAAQDAPTSALSVIYTPDHVFKEYRFFPKNPAIVLVDSKVIAEAPARWLAAGMGDAASKKFEGEAVVRTGSKNLAVAPEWFGVSTDFSLTIARLQYDRLLQYGEAAMASVRAKAVTPALEAIIETNILWSGIAFESTGLAAAHSIYDGFTVIEELIPEEYRPVHGELVNFGALVQLAMEDAPKDLIVNHMIWSHSVGLPITFSELGFDETKLTDEHLWKVAEKATSPGETIHTQFFLYQGAKEIGPYKAIYDATELVFYALKYINELGHRVAEKYPRVPYEKTWTPYDAFIKYKKKE